MDELIDIWINRWIGYFSQYPLNVCRTHIRICNYFSWRIKTLDSCKFWANIVKLKNEDTIVAIIAQLP